MATSPTKQRSMSSYSRRRSGSLYPIVMGVSAIVTCLAVAGLEMSRVTAKANQQLRQQLEARRMAQAGLEYWQRQYNAQKLSDPTRPLKIDIDPNSGFYVAATVTPLGRNPLGAAQVTSTGRFGGAIQRLTARFEARPTLYESYRCALLSDQGSIDYTDATVHANHWSRAQQDTSASGSNLFLDAMTAGNFSADKSSFQQRSISAVPWKTHSVSFDSSDLSYPGHAYLKHPEAVTIQPPSGTDQLIRTSRFSRGVAPWRTTSSAKIRLDKTTGYCSKHSACVTNRDEGNDGPAIDVTQLLVKDAVYRVKTYIKPKSKANFRFTLNYYYDGQRSIASQITSENKSATPGTWTAMEWEFSVPPSKLQPDKIDLGIISDRDCDFNFDLVTMYNTNRNGKTVYIENTVLSESNNPFSKGRPSPSAAGIYIIDCRNRVAQIANCRIRSTLVFINCTRVELLGGIVWEVPNRNYPAIITEASIVDCTTLSSLGDNTLREEDISFNLNPSHTPFEGDSDQDLFDLYQCGIQGAIFSCNSITFGEGGPMKGKRLQLTGPALAKDAIVTKNTTVSIAFPSDMILNPPPGFYPDFTPMRLIPSSIDEWIPNVDADALEVDLLTAEATPMLEELDFPVQPIGKDQVGEAPKTKPQVIPSLGVRKNARESVRDLQEFSRAETLPLITSTRREKDWDGDSPKTKRDDEWDDDKWDDDKSSDDEDWSDEDWSDEDWSDEDWGDDDWKDERKIKNSKEQDLKLREENQKEQAQKEEKLREERKKQEAEKEKEKQKSKDKDRKEGVSRSERDQATPTPQQKVEGRVGETKSQTRVEQQKSDGAAKTAPSSVTNRTEGKR